MNYAKASYYLRKEMRITMLVTLLLSSSVMATQQQFFQNIFFNSGFNNNVWSSFNDQFNDEIRSMQNDNIFGAQANRYFDNATNHYIIKLKASGLTKENLNIYTKGNMIHIGGNIQKIEKTPNSSRTSSSQFSQSYSLPKDADQENINVEFKDGLLIISIPKLAEIKQE